MDNTKGQDSQPATHDFARAQAWELENLDLLLHAGVSD